MRWLIRILAALLAYMVRADHGGERRELAGDRVRTRARSGA